MLGHALVTKEAEMDESDLVEDKWDESAHWCAACEYDETHVHYR